LFPLIGGEMLSPRDLCRISEVVMVELG